MDHAEGQGWKIGLVVFFLLTIVFAVLWYVYFDKYDRQVKIADDAAKQMQAARSEAERTVREYNDLKERVAGAKTEGDHATLMQLADQELKQPKLNPQRLQQTNAYASYSAGVGYLQTELANADTRIASLEADRTKLENELKIVKTQYEGEKEQVYQAQQSKEKELAEQTTKLMGIIRERDVDLENLQKRYQETSNKLEQLQQDVTVRTTHFERTITNLQIMNQKLKQRSDLEKINKFASADGRIVEISSRGDYATINLGQQDGVKTGLTFGIYGPDPRGNPYAAPKANLEITRIIDARRSEGRITGIDATQPPVIRDDQIFNPIWNPGQKESIGVVGLIYMDGDDQPDNEEFKRLVEEFGGKIDCEMNMKTGQVIGQITINTGWLVIGTIPDPDKFEKNEEMRDLIQKLTLARSAMEHMANDASVPRIPVRNFLTYMGHDLPQRTVLAGAEEDYLRRRMVPRPKLDKPLIIEETEEK